MDGNPALQELGFRSERAGECDSCPRCGCAAPPSAGVQAAVLGGVVVRRCTRCGARSTRTTPSLLVFSCESCGLPFRTQDLLPHSEQQCQKCRSGQSAAALPDLLVVRATEHEVRSALSAHWRFVTSPTLATYLERIVRQVARRVEGAPESSHVVLVDDPSLRTLALPSGTLLMSVGMLSFLEDEAELAFLLGHELAHAASGEAAVRLVRLGFDAVARGPAAPPRESWAEAALDLVRLGYGRRRERDADARALEAISGLDYDPESVLRYLRRLDSLLEANDTRAADIAVSHPLPHDRARRIEKMLWGRPPVGRIQRSNREVFRRAVRREIAVGALTRTEMPVATRASGPGADIHRVTTGGRHPWRTALVVAAIALAVASAALGAIVLFR